MMNLIQFLTPYLSVSVQQQLVTALDNTADITTEISGLVTDNRDVQTGDCFIAMAGITHHGEKFIDDAIARGASAILVETDTKSVDIRQNKQKNNKPIIAISDLTQKIKHLLKNC